MPQSLRFFPTQKGKPKSRKGKKSRSNQRKANSQRQPVGFTLSECASKYALAVGNPFNSGARGACIPTFPSRSSQKLSAIARGTFEVGTNGFGFFALSPCASNDNDCIFTSTVGYTPTTISIDPDNTLTTGSNYGLAVAVHQMSQLPYKSATLTDATAGSGPSMNARIVSCGVRIRYIGTQLDLGGRLTAYVSPSHSNLNGTSYHGLASRPEAINLAVSRQWSETVVFANTTDETEYPGHAFSLDNQYEVLRAVYPLSNNESMTGGNTGKTIGGVPIVFAIESKGGNSFEYEVITHIEFIGKSAAPYLTRSHCDIEGLSIVQNAAGSAKLERAGTSEHGSWKTVAKNIGSEVWEHRRQIGQAIGAAYRAYSNPASFMAPSVRAIMN